MGSFNDNFTNVGWPMLRDQLGQPATYVSPSSSSSVTIVFSEMVGFVDELSRALIYIGEDEVSDPQRGDYIIVNSRRWHIVDVRTDNVGVHELRCDAPEEDI